MGDLIVSIEVVCNKTRLPMWLLVILNGTFEISHDNVRAKNLRLPDFAVIELPIGYIIRVNYT